jgi:CheY-like chemotaxis protein
MALKILAVDEEASSLQLVRSLAAPLRHVVLALNDYQAAGQRAESQQFDVIFVGMRSGEPGGLELTHRVRNSAPNSESTIVILSATEDIPSLRKALGEGADFFLVKPLTSGRMRALLAAMDAPDWKNKKRAARLTMFTEVHCTWEGRPYPLRSLNISQSGILLQGPLTAEIGQEVTLEFHMGEARTLLKVHGRIIRKEAGDRLGLEFVALAPEDKNAIQLYVLGRLKELTPARRVADLEIPKPFWS